MHNSRARDLEISLDIVADWGNASFYFMLPLGAFELFKAIWNSTAVFSTVISYPKEISHMAVDSKF